MTTKRAWSLPQIAELCGISERHAYRLAEDGTLPGKEGRYDPIDCARRFIKHTSKDAEGKRARMELARVEARRKTLLMRRQLGELVTVKELRQFVAHDVWASCLNATGLVASYCFYILKEELQDEQRARSIAGRCADAGNTEMVTLREALERKLADVRQELRAADRIDQAMVELAGNAEGEHGGDER